MRIHCLTTVFVPFCFDAVLLLDLWFCCFTSSGSERENADRTDFFVLENPIIIYHRSKIVYHYVIEQINGHDSAVSLPNIFVSKKTRQQWFRSLRDEERSTPRWWWFFLTWSQACLDFFSFPQLSVCLNCSLSFPQYLVQCAPQIAIVCNGTIPREF